MLLTLAFPTSAPDVSSLRAEPPKRAFYTIGALFLGGAVLGALS